MKDSIATSLEQSKQLRELGIDPNTASMTWVSFGKNYAWTLSLIPYKGNEKDYFWAYCPAWTLGDLLDLLPQRLGDKHLFPNGKDYLGNSPSRLMIELGGNRIF